MDLHEALKESSKGTASRIEEKNGKTYTTIGYNDGSGIILVSKDNKVDFPNTREATKKELEGFSDWKPTK